MTGKESGLAPTRDSLTLRFWLPTTTRALFFGGVFGALLMLIALPKSRPSYIAPFRPSRIDRQVAGVAALVRGEQLREPKTLLERALWLRVASARLLKGEVLTSREVKTLDDLAREGAVTEAENAFWPQARMVLAVQSNDYDAAFNFWTAAGQCSQWDDGQTALLSGPVAQVPDVSAYVYGQLFKLRNSDFLQELSIACRALLKKTWGDSARCSRVRLATALNGQLVRKFSRSLELMNDGIDLSELGISPPGDDSLPGQHRLLLARLKFDRDIGEAKIGYSTDEVEEIFRQNDGALALTGTDSPASYVESQTQWAAITGAAPGALLGAAVVGLGLILVGRGYRWALESGRKVGTWPMVWVMHGVVGLPLLIGAAFYVIPAAFATLALCLLFSFATPKQARTKRPVHLGPLFSLVQCVVAIVLVLAIGATFVLHSAPGKSLSGDEISGLVSPTAFATLIALTLSATLLCAPLWAFAQRLPTFHVLTLALGGIGRTTLLIGLLASVVSGPACLYADRRLRDPLEKIFYNEPIYFLRR